MKMEQEIVSERSGEIKEIFVKEGDPVERGDILMQIL
jgi:biotin carboxyl carrier protein